MTTPTTPYSSYLGDQNPLEAIRSTLDKVQELTGAWPPNRFERPYAPGKWSARQVLTHLAQTELVVGTRARMALATPGYVAQGWNQDAWIALDAHLTGRAAMDAFAAAARMNLAFYEGLSSADRATTFVHPEFGELTIDWVIHQMAGHQINHLLQLQRIP